MTFFEKELRKVIEPLKLGAVYVGGKTTYIPLGDVKIRVDFHNSFSVGNYDELLVKVINKKDGDVDVITIKFRDVWGKRPTTNPNFRDGVMPHIWVDRETDWYVYHPTESDYKILTNEVKKLVDIYR